MVQVETAVDLNDSWKAAASMLALAKPSETCTVPHMIQGTHCLVKTKKHDKNYKH